MRRRATRIGLGLVLVLVVTVLLSGAVATSVAITDELSDGDTCETDGKSFVKPTATPGEVTEIAANVPKCIVNGDDSDAPAASPTPGDG